MANTLKQALKHFTMPSILSKTRKGSIVVRAVYK